MADFVRRWQSKALSRRELLRLGGFGAAALAGGHLLPFAPRDGEAASHPPREDRPRPHTARYTLRVEASEIAPAGVPVRALLANGTLPGTEIRVKEGELLRIQVENALEEPTSLHWHGLLLPAAMDGVPGISQAPIAPGQVFVYEYPIRQAGTYWYHSHVELQEQLGLSGPFIIEAKDEPLLINPGDRVQVELVNETRMAHPMHVHGHFFRLLTASGDDPLAPLKDTVAVWPRETVRFEFYADNPGKWFFHCHNLYHLETGMAREWHYVI